MRTDVVAFSGIRTHFNTQSVGFSVPIKKAAVTLTVLGVVGWLGWLAWRMKAENSELEAQLSAIRGDQSYEILNQESLKIWQNAPDAVKSAIPPDQNPILALNPEDPSGVVAQISQLSHQMYGCYDTKARLASELKDWKERENHSSSLADQRHHEVIDAKNEMISSKDSWMGELKNFQKERETALESCRKEKEDGLQECQTKYKLSQQAADEKREYMSRLCEDKINIASLASEEKKDKALQACEKQKNEQSQFWQEERRKIQSDCDTLVNTCNEKRVEELMKYNKEKNPVENANANESIEKLQIELAASRKELTECKNSRCSRWFGL